MADIDTQEFLQDTLQSHTGDTDYATVMTVAAANWVANATYLMLCTARIGLDDGNTVGGWKLNQATSGDIAQSEHLMEPADVGSEARPHSYSWWGVYVVPGTAEDVRVQHKTFASGQTVRTDSVSLIKVRLDADLTENTDWRVASNSSLTNLTTSYVTFADTGSFTPGTPADHRLILAVIRIGVDLLAVQHDFKLQQDIDGAGFTDIGGINSVEGEDTSEERIYVWAWPDDSGSSGTRQYRIQAKDEATGANDHIYSSIFVLEANAFESHTEDLNTTPLTGTDALQVLNSVASYTPTNTGNHLVLTNVNVNPNGAQSWSKSFEVDDVVVDADYDDEDSGRRWDNSDQQPHFRARLLSFDSGGDKLEQTGNGLASAGTWDDRMLWASSVALASAGPQTITGSLLARSPTFPTGAVTPDRLVGVLLARSPTFPTGAVNATNTLAGVLLSRSPTFPTGAVTSAITIAGTLLAHSPTFPTGAVNATNTLTGVLLSRSPTFPTGAVAATNTITGTLLARSPTFPTGTITAGAVTITGLLLARSPTFPIGSLNVPGDTITGVLLVRSPTFPIGVIIFTFPGAGLSRGTGPRVTNRGTGGRPVLAGSSKPW